MNNLQIFNFKGNSLRTVMIGMEPWFVAKDICDVLTLSNSRKTLQTIETDEVTSSYVIDSLGRKQKMNCVNESGLYSLIMQSRKPEAKKFKRWVTHEVLPSIRKTGSYIIPDKREHLLAMAVLEAEKIIKEQRLLLLENNEKVEAFDTFLTAHNNQPMNVVAKSLGMGRNNLFAILRESSIFMDNNTPYQRYMRHFVVIERIIPIGAEAIFKPQTFVKPSGVEFIRKLLAR